MSLLTAALRAAATSASISGGQLPGYARGWVCTLLQRADAWAPDSLAARGGARHRHSVALERESVVPQEILRELQQLDASLRDASNIDGRRRASQPTSAPALPFPLPPHAIEPGLPLLPAHVRPAGCGGRLASKWLRRGGRVPGRLSSLPGNMEVALHLAERDLAKMLRTFGRNGCAARVFQLDIMSPPPPPTTPTATTSTTTPSTSATPTTSSTTNSSTTSSTTTTTTASSSGGSSGPTVLGSVRVKPVAVQLNAVSGALEAVDLMYCPLDRVVVVDVPLRLLHDDLAPGAKKGGWMCMSRRTVRYKALGSAVPPYIEVNVRHMELNQSLRVRDLPVPPGTKIYEKDFNALVLRCTTDVGKD